MPVLSFSRSPATPLPDVMPGAAADLAAGTDSATRSPQPSAPPPPGRTRVLIIDDNEALGELTKLIFEQLGQVVYTATTGAQGRRLLQQLQPDVVVCDVNLPDESGYDLLSKVRAKLGASHPPFVFLTGGPGIDTDSCRRLGAAAVLPKPYPMRELSKLVGMLHLHPHATAVPMQNAFLKLSM